ncbi:dTDP-glucose 4,6-dehydratase [Tuberibacillus sp. Marseille-P3662]|uniref:dTDP-glucose 4,6-dehydratase n=1 Tax=Tuberibacillus sp. Marseille-P3662 TaxID=1965358 RepID=UPI000A1CA20E|nr:dTDP-glucose 4,6-dehydratase [Tuberibacillus sp. Marseille-P3662]
MLNNDSGRTVLVTGGSGFIGSNFILYYLDQHPQDTIINMDKLTYAGNADRLQAVEQHPNYQFIKGDIGDSEILEQVFTNYGITDLIHFAAESHVDNAIHEPDPFIKTNLLGTYELLKKAKRHWIDRGQSKEGRFHHISTDEVYGTLRPDETAFLETSPYTPNNPYSASKAGAAMLVRSYQQTYGLDAVITNCSNNYGPRQHSEKLIPTIIRKALAEQAIPIYGDGKQVRDWLHVKDHCRAVDLVFHHGQSGEVYNIGGRNEQYNIHIAEKICELLDEYQSVRSSANIGSYRDLITFVQDRPGHDRRYSINPEKIENELRWKAEIPLADGLRETVAWYIDNNIV